MPDDFKATTDAQNDKRREADIRDHNDALANRDNGRNTHGGIRKAQDTASEHSKKAQRATLDALLTDPAYAAAYKSAVKAYGRAQEAVYDGMAKAASELASAERAMKETLDSATALEDGTKVFMAQDGGVYDEKGRKLNDDECAGIDWKEGSPHWEKYQKDQARLTDAQKQQEYMSGLDKRLREIHKELESGTDFDRLPKLKEELEQVELGAKRGHKTTNEMETNQNNSPVVGNLDMGFNQP